MFTVHIAVKWRKIQKLCLKKFAKKLLTLLLLINASSLIFTLQSHTCIHPKFLYVSAHICKRLSIHNFNLYLSTQLLCIPMDSSSSLPLQFPSVLIPLLQMSPLLLTIQHIPLKHRKCGHTCNNVVDKIRNYKRNQSNSSPKFLYRWYNFASPPGGVLGKLSFFQICRQYLVTWGYFVGKIFPNTSCYLIGGSW